MKTLLILRHAKSSWKDSGLPDFERPLNTRGRRAADLIGTFMKRKKLQPDLVLSSTATRARETIGLVVKSAYLGVDVRYDQRLYLAGAATLIDVISQIEEERNRVMLVGHNPGLEELVARLTGVDEQMPTAALARISLDISSWVEIAKVAHGRLEWLVKPRELAPR